MVDSAAPDSVVALLATLELSASGEELLRLPAPKTSAHDFALRSRTDCIPALSRRGCSSHVAFTFSSGKCGSPLSHLRTMLAPSAAHKSRSLGNQEPGEEAEILHPDSVGSCFSGSITTTRRTVDGTPGTWMDRISRGNIVERHQRVSSVGRRSSPPGRGWNITPSQGIEQRMTEEEAQEDLYQRMPLPEASFGPHRPSRGSGIVH